MNSLALQRNGRIISMIGVLEWKDTDPLGRTGRGDEEGVSSSVSEQL